jgi:hypothetical protein
MTPVQESERREPREEREREQERLENAEGKPETTKQESPARHLPRPTRR